MNVEIPHNQIEQLDTLAAQTGKGTGELVREAVSKMLAYNDWFKAQVQIGIDQIQRGNFMEEPEMNARVQKMLRS